MDKLGSSNTRVLLTGSNGLLGQKLTDFIIQKTNYLLCCTSQGVNRNPNDAGYDFVQLDLLDKDGLKALIQEFQPSHIIHCAAMTSVEACEQEAEKCQQLNVDLVGDLANWAREFDYHLTFLSTDFVFDGKNGPYKEGDPVKACNAYGQSKIEAEALILGSGCRAAILRTILVYGVIADKNRSNLVLWAKQKLEKGEKINVVDDQWRMPTWVDDLAMTCILSVEKNAKGIFHISSEQQYSIIEAVYEIADFWGLDKSLISPVHAADIGQAENRPQRTGFYLDKAKTELGYVPTSFKESLNYIDQQIKYYNS